jgi:hypothetical protein
MQAVETADPCGRILQLIFAPGLLCFSEQTFGKIKHSVQVKGEGP